MLSEVAGVSLYFQGDTRVEVSYTGQMLTESPLGSDLQKAPLSGYCLILPAPRRTTGVLTAPSQLGHPPPPSCSPTGVLSPPGHRKAARHCHATPKCLHPLPQVWVTLPLLRLPASVHLHPPKHTHQHFCFLPPWEISIETVWSGLPREGERDADARRFLINSHPVAHGLALISPRYSDL